MINILCDLKWKVKVTIIHTRCILVTEAVTVSNVIAVAARDSEMRLGTNRQTYIICTETQT